MKNESYKNKVQKMYPNAYCMKGHDNRFYVKNIHELNCDQGISGGNATKAWARAYDSCKWFEAVKMIQG